MCTLYTPLVIVNTFDIKGIIHLKIVFPLNFIFYTKDEYKENVKENDPFNLP